MGLVIEGLFALGVLLAALWLWSLRGSVVRDRAEAQRRRQEEQAARERAGWTGASATRGSTPSRRSRATN